MCPLNIFSFSIITCTHTHRGRGGGKGEDERHSGAHTRGAKRSGPTLTGRAHALLCPRIGESPCVTASENDRHLIVGRIVRVSPIEDTSPTGGPGTRLRYVALRWVTLSARLRGKKCVRHDVTRHATASETLLGPYCSLKALKVVPACARTWHSGRFITAPPRNGRRGGQSRRAIQRNRRPQHASPSIPRFAPWCVKLFENDRVGRGWFEFAECSRAAPNFTMRLNWN